MPERIVFKSPEVIAAQRQTAKLYMALQAGRVDRSRFERSSSPLPKREDYEDNQKLLASYRQFRQRQTPNLLDGQPLTPERISQQARLEQEAVRREILESLNQTNFFTPQTIGRSVESEATFASLMQTLVTQMPQIVTVIPDVLYVTVPQEFKRGLQKFQEEYEGRFYMTFGDFARFYSAEEVKEVMNQMKKNGTLILPVFFSPDVLKHYMDDGSPSEEGKAFLRQVVQEDMGDVGGQQFVDRAITEGFLTPEEVQNAVVSFMSREEAPFMEGLMASRKVHVALEYAKYFPQESWGQLQEQVEALALEHLSLSEIFRSADFFGEDGERLVQSAKSRFIADLFSGEERANGFGEIAYLREELSDLPPEVVETYIHRYKILNSFRDVVFLLEKNSLSPDEKKRIADALFTDLPTIETNDPLYLQTRKVGERVIGDISSIFSSVNVLDELLVAYSPKKRDQADTVKRVIQQTSSHIAFEAIDRWIAFIPAGERKEFMRQYVGNHEDSSFALASEVVQKPKGTLGTLFTRDEVIGLVRQAGIIGQNLDGLKDVRALFADDKQFHSYLHTAGDKDPVRFIASVVGLAGEVFRTDEVKDLIMTLSQRHEEVAAELFESIEGWAPQFVVNGDGAFVQKFIQVNRLRLGEKILDNLHKVVRFVDEAHQDQFISDAIGVNPAKAVQMYLLGETGMQLGLSYEQIIEIGAKAMEEYAKKYAPKILTEFYAKLRTLGDSPARQALLANTEEVYRAITKIRASGLEDIFFAAQAGTVSIDTNKLTPAVERELLFVFETYAHFMQQDSARFTLDLAKKMRSLDLAVKLLAEELGTDILGRRPTEDELNNFHNAVDNPMALFVYFMKYSSSESHKEVLTTMMQSLFSGEKAYQAWRFGGEGEDAFSEAGPFLPKNLTYEQYLIWRKERTTSLRDVLAADNIDVQNAVRKLMKQKRKDLHFALEEHATLPFSQESLEIVQTAIQANGQSLARVNKELGSLRKQNPQTNQVVELEEERGMLMSRREALAHDRKVLRMALITANEVVEGALLEGKSKGQSVASLLAELKHFEEERGAQEGALAYSEIEQYFLEYAQQSQEAVNLEAFDTANIRLTMEIGRKPVGSCQDFAHGGYNKCLVGYTNQSVKPMFLAISGRDSLVARNIERLLDTSDGHVGLHMERIYSASASPLVQIAMYEHAMRIAEEMGVELYTSSFAQNEEGIAQESVAPRGFHYEAMPGDFFLTSPEESRAPWQYVDSGGGPQQGQFRLQKLYKIVRDTSSVSGRRR